MSDNVDSTSSTPPASPASRVKAWWLGLPSWLNVLIIGVVLFGALVGLILAQNPNTAANATKECQDRVELKLKSPSTADFGDATAQELGDTGARWEVIGIVDAENSFGGTVRLTYKCDITYNETAESWSASLVDVRE